jgi:hypothetical protein
MKISTKIFKKAHKSPHKGLIVPDSMDRKLVGSFGTSYGKLWAFEIFFLEKIIFFQISMKIIAKIHEKWPKFSPELV